MASEMGNIYLTVRTYDLSYGASRDVKCVYTKIYVRHPNNEPNVLISTQWLGPAMATIDRRVEYGRTSINSPWQPADPDDKLVPEDDRNPSRPAR